MGGVIDSTCIVLRKLKKVNEPWYNRSIDMRIETSKFGDKMWFNEKGQLHNIIDHALMWESGAKFWYRNGKFHRLDGPAEIYSNRTQYWCWFGKYVSEQKHALLSNMKFFTRRVQI